MGILVLAQPRLMPLVYAPNYRPCLQGGNVSGIRCFSVVGPSQPLAASLNGHPTLSDLGSNPLPRSRQIQAPVPPTA